MIMPFLICTLQISLEAMRLPSCKQVLYPHNKKYRFFLEQGKQSVTCVLLTMKVAAAIINSHFSSLSLLF